MAASSADALLKEDADVFLLESGWELALEAVVLATLATVVTLAANTAGLTPGDRTIEDSIVLNDTGGDDDAEDFLLEGLTPAAASMGRFRDGAVFPRDVGRGVSGGPAFNTIIQEVADGSEFRISKWQRPKRRYNIATAVDTPEDFRKVMGFYRHVHGAEFGFRMRDPFDWTTHTNHTSAPSETNYAHKQQIGAGDGTTTEYLLVKRYRVSDLTERVRPITRPTHTDSADHVFAVFVDGVKQTEGTGSHYTVQRAGGLVVFNSAPTAGTTIEWCGTFDVPVRFEQDVDQGMLAEMRTTEFYGLDLTAIELSDGEAFSDHRWMGGVETVTTAEDMQVWLGGGRLWRITASASSLKMYLPHTEHLVDGGPHLTIYNAGSNAFAVKHNQASDSVPATCVTSLAAGKHATFVLKNDWTYLPIE